MQNSFFLKTISQLLFPSFFLAAIFLLLRGHNAPGGGFIAGLLVASAFSVVGLSFGTTELRRKYRLESLTLVRWGLLVALVSGFIGLFTKAKEESLLRIGAQFFEGSWVFFNLPWLGTLALGSPMLFDLGVFLVVVGIGVNFTLLILE